MPEDTGTPAVRPKLEMDTSGMALVYSNHYAIGQTVFDVRLIFGELTDFTAEKIVVTQRVQVTMSWLEAKALAEGLAVYVKNYEKAYGPIRTEFTQIQNPKLPEIPKILPKPTES
jgi:hypothetical protein